MKKIKPLAVEKIGNSVYVIYKKDLVDKAIKKPSSILINNNRHILIYDSTEIDMKRWGAGVEVLYFKAIKE